MEGWPMKPLYRRWNAQAAAMLVLLLATSAMTHRAALLDIWTVAIGVEEQSHILLAPLVMLWLFWLRRSRLRSMPSAPSNWGVALVALGWVSSWLGFREGIQVLWHAGALVSFVGCLVAVLGPRILLTFGPAFAAMLFFIPVPGTIRQLIAIPLQEQATVITQSSLELLGVPASRSGNLLLINGEQVAVGEACNGMRMVFSLSLIVYAFTFSVPLRNSIRVVLLILSPITALIANITRLIPTTLVYGYGSIEDAEIFHDIAGWIMLPVSMFMLYLFLRTIRWIELPINKFRLTMQ
jgi:exosortase